MLHIGNVRRYVGFTKYQVMQKKARVLRNRGQKRFCPICTLYLPDWIVCAIDWGPRGMPCEVNTFSYRQPLCAGRVKRHIAKWIADQVVQK